MLFGHPGKLSGSVFDLTVSEPGDVLLEGQQRGGEGAVQGETVAFFHPGWWEGAGKAGLLRGCKEQFKNLLYTLWHGRIALGVRQDDTGIGFKTLPLYHRRRWAVVFEPQVDRSVSRPTESCFCDPMEGY